MIPAAAGLLFATAAGPTSTPYRQHPMSHRPVHPAVTVPL